MPEVHQPTTVVELILQQLTAAAQAMQQVCNTHPLIACWAATQLNGTVELRAASKQPLLFAHRTCWLHPTSNHDDSELAAVDPRKHKETARNRQPQSSKKHS
jgi:hypothetical protein